MGYHTFALIGVRYLPGEYAGKIFIPNDGSSGTFLGYTIMREFNGAYADYHDSAVHEIYLAHKIVALSSDLDQLSVLWQGYSLVRQEMREKLKPLGLWDEKGFGIYLMQHIG